MSNNKFQFPSNGKVDSKLYSITKSMEIKMCFNSLQTGKWIQSKEFNNEDSSFN